MRYVLNTLFLLAFCMTMFGQSKIGPQEQQQVIQKFNSASSSLRTMYCDFVQTKKMKLLKNEMQSKGVLYYSSPNRLRWQYNTPYSYLFILNGDNVYIKSGTKKQNIDVKRNKIFRQISSVILQCITGGRLNNSSDFTVEIQKTNDTYSARLDPKKKELKKLYSIIEIYFNHDLTMVNSVRLEETTGDTTIVELKNVKTNTSISENLFSLN